MIAGHLQIKNDYYYMVLSYTDSDGKRKQPWIPTGLPVKGNKKRLLLYGPELQGLRRQAKTAVDSDGTSREGEQKTC